MHAVNRMPAGILQARVDVGVGRDQRGVDRLHPVACNQTQGCVTRCGHQIKPTLVHQGHHFVTGVGGLDGDHALGRCLELGHPIIGGIGFAALDIASPGHNAQRAFAGTNGSHFGKSRTRRQAEHGQNGTGGGQRFH